MVPMAAAGNPEAGRLRLAAVQTSDGKAEGQSGCGLTHRHDEVAINKAVGQSNCNGECGLSAEPVDRSADTAQSFRHLRESEKQDRQCDQAPLGGDLKQPVVRVRADVALQCGKVHWCQAKNRVLHDCVPR